MRRKNQSFITFQSGHDLIDGWLAEQMEDMNCITVLNMDEGRMNECLRRGRE